MKLFFKIIFISILSLKLSAQQATEIDAKFLKLPRYANQAAVTAALPTPTQGMLIYRLDTKSNWYYDGFAWKDMNTSSVSVPSPLYLTSTGTTITGETNQADEAGVMGINTTTGVGYAVLGKTTSTNPDEHTVGVKGENLSTNGVGYGVQGYHAGTGWAGYFEGHNALKTQGNTYLNGDVGIGTDSPFGKLTINTQSTNWNFPSLLLTDDATNNEGGAILQFRNPSDKRMYLQSHFGSQADGTDSYMTFSHNAFYNMRLRGDGNLGIGSLNPNLAGLVVNKKVGNVHAIFGDNTSGVSIESNFPGIHFNSYYNGSRKTISTGYTSGLEMNPTTGDFSIYTSPASTTAGATASVYERLKISKEGTVNIGETNNMTILNTGNVGIGKTAPTQKLEVNGKIKLSDDAVTPVAGTMRWNPATNDFEGFNGNAWYSFTKQGYRFSRVYNNTLTNIFTIPAGVKEVMIEQWGAGGGGTWAGGGGSGSYSRYVIDVSALTTFNVINGIGGEPTTTRTGTATAGLNSVVVINGVTYNTLGGSAATNNSPGGNTLSQIYDPAGGTILKSFFTLPGNTGEGQKKVVEFECCGGCRYTNWAGGKGGDAPMGSAAGGSAGNSRYVQCSHIPTPEPYGTDSNPTEGIDGSGGGSGYNIISYSPFVNIYGARGGNGKTIIWW